MERKRKINGYYFDGEKTWVMYIDEDGNITYKEMKDE